MKGTMIRRSGADYAYLYESLGPFIAFLRVWIESLIVRPLTLTVMSLTLATYLTTPFFPDGDCVQPHLATNLLAAFAIGMLIY